MAGKDSPSVAGQRSSVTRWSATGEVPHLTRAEREALGTAATAELPLDAHASFQLRPNRPDPVGLLERQAETRIAELVPIRYGRMSASPFAFYRGAAVVMADDLAGTPRAGLRVQLCGDAHVANFGVFGSPERHLLFDINDFDETLPGPFEWDVKRLATSLEIAGRDNGFKVKERRTAVLAAVGGYRRAMADFAGRSNLAVWYADLDIDQSIAALDLDRQGVKRTEAVLTKARTHDTMQAVAKLTTRVGDEPRIISDPPLLVPLDELLPDHQATPVLEQLHGLLRSYRDTLQPDRRHLLEQYRLVDMARKVVGVGSVGARVYILLLDGLDGADPIFLQAKEAKASVLEKYAGASPYTNHAERVVAGQHLMQAQSDIFLGWERATVLDCVERDFSVRQLRDWKGSVAVEDMVPAGMAVYAGMCGWTLARAHARSGDRIAIAAYLGSEDTFDEAVADFAGAYADQNDRDHSALKAAVESGRVIAMTGV